MSQAVCLLEKTEAQKGEQVLKINKWAMQLFPALRKQKQVGEEGL